VEYDMTMATEYLYGDGIAPPLELLSSQQDTLTHHVAPLSRGSIS
jgi:hypothetical protein